MSDMVGPALTQLLGQSPVLVVYLVGMILAVVLWRRHPGPCRLVLLATVCLLVLTVAHTVVVQYLIHAHVELGWTHEKLGWTLSAVGLTGSVLRALGLGLLLAAVFLGRGAAGRAGPNPGPGPGGG